MEENWELKDIFATVRRVRSARLLQDIVCICQNLGMLSEKYEFIPASGTRALPYSAKLDYDLSELESGEIIVDTMTRNSYVLTEKGKSEGKELEGKSRELLNRLVNEDATTLDSMASVAFVRSLLSEEDPRQIAGYFATSQKKVEKYLKLLDELKPY